MMAERYAGERHRTLRLIIDSAESRGKLIPSLNEIVRQYKGRTGRDLKLEMRTLRVGDAMWEIDAPGNDNHGKQFGPLIERKAANDLWSSITGVRRADAGRYEHCDQQAGHMNELGVPEVNTYWIVEGVFDPDMYRDGGQMSAKVLVSKEASMLIDGRNIVQAQSSLHTALAIVYMHDALEHLAPEKAVKHKFSYLDYLTVTGKKRDLHDAYRWAEELALIPGLSMEMVQLLIREYPSRPDLLKAYHRQPHEKARKEMIKKNAALPGFGKTLSERVYTFSEYDKIQHIFTGNPTHDPTMPTDTPASLLPPKKKLKLQKVGEGSTSHHDPAFDDAFDGAFDDAFDDVVDDN